MKEKDLRLVNALINQKRLDRIRRVWTEAEGFGWN